VAEAGTPFKVLSGLVEEFGSERVLDTPISEAGFTGMGVGAAMTGLRPLWHYVGDFLTLTMDQLVNQAAKVHYMSGENVESADGVADNAWRHAAVGRRSIRNRCTRGCATCLAEGGYALDSIRREGLLKTAIRDDNPVIIFEDKMM